MHSVRVTGFADWRLAARALLQADVAPGAVNFSRQSDQLLFDEGDSLPPPTNAISTHVSRKFLDAAKVASYYRDDRVWTLLYSLLWRQSHGEPELHEDATDDQVRDFERIAKAVSRDAHKMKAFVRFKKVASQEGTQPGSTHYVAWHRPDHFVVQHVAPFFARRFTDMHWSIFTPDESVSWDGQELHFGRGVPASSVMQSDDFEELWRTYYRSAFNPARIKLDMMKKEMPVRHWATLPETRILPEMLAEAPQRVAEMLANARPATKTVAGLLPEERSLEALSAVAANCQACDLCYRATQTVFGSGSATARMMLVGEQPGDEEDIQGMPFVGPAGQLLRQAVAEAGIDWQDLFVTNAVKHFHWEPRGKRRLHKQPPARALSACRDWLKVEIELISPQIVVCLGVNAAKAVMGPDNRLFQGRGKIQAGMLATSTLATWHPAAILRAVNAQRRDEMFKELVTHLRFAHNGVSV